MKKNLSKRILAFLLVVMLAVPASFCAFAEEDPPKVTLTYVDAEGNTQEVELEGGYADEEAGVYAYNDLPDGGIHAEVFGQNDTVIGLLIDGDIVLVDKDIYYNALDLENQVAVTVEGDIETDGPAIDILGDDTSVEVNGDVQAGHEYEYSDGSKSGDGYGVQVQGDSIVSISGSLTSEGTAIYSFNNTEYGVEKETENSDGTKTITQDVESIATEAEIFVGGDVTSNYGYGVNVKGDTEITIKGSVTSEDDAVEACGDSSVTVEGNVTSTSGTGVQALKENTEWTSTWVENADGTRISYEAVQTGEPRDQATVKVGGDVKAYDTGVYANGQSTVEIAGNVTAGHVNESKTSTGETRKYGSGYGVYALEDATATIGGNVTAQNTGVIAADNGKVNVGGSVNSELGAGITATGLSYGNKDKDAVNKSTVTVGEDVNAYGNGISTNGEAFVSVGGNVTAGHTETYTQPDGTPYSYASGVGISAGGESTVTVGGNVTSESTGIWATSSWKSGGSPETVVNGDGTMTVTYKQDKDFNQAEVTVFGDLTSNGGMGIDANGKSDIIVAGSVKSESTGVAASGDASVLVVGNVNSKNGIAISADTEMTAYENVYVYKCDENGNPVLDEDGNQILVSSTYNQKTSESAGNVVVCGNVTDENDTAISMNGDSKVTVWGDVTGGYVPREADGDADDGDDDYEPSAEEKAYMEAWEKAFEGVEIADFNSGVIQINLNEEGNDGQLIVGGTVKAHEDNVPVVIRYNVDNTADMATMPDLPEMKIYEIVPEGGEYFDVNILLRQEFDYSYVDEETGETVTVKDAEGSAWVELSDEDHAAMVEAIAKSIQYIIKLNAINGSFELSGAAYDEENGIYTAHEEDQVSVTIRPDEGYELDGLEATGNYTLTKNDDGTWTLVIHRGGGVTLTATISEASIPAPAAPAATTTTEDSTPAPAPVYTGKPAAALKGVDDSPETVALKEQVQALVDNIEEFFSFLPDTIKNLIPEGFKKIRQILTMELFNYTDDMGEISFTIKTDKKYAKDEEAFVLFLVPNGGDTLFLGAKAVGLADGTLKVSPDAETLKQLSNKKFVAIVLDKKEAAE